MDIDLSAMVTQYSVAKHGDMYLAPNFTVKEFACKDGSDPVFINVLIPLVCQIVRNQTGKGFTPNSAYRTITHNKASKGTAKSNHIYGNAIDIPAVGWTVQSLYNFLDKLVGDTCELGIYKTSGFVHLGIQNTKVRFVGD